MLLLNNASVYTFYFPENDVSIYKKNCVEGVLTIFLHLSIMILGD
uniref:Uncharacterized protein n=1 Tax=Arundo donax TaxID=35708 RepID=A0A0A8YRQ9_ARUDO